MKILYIAHRIPYPPNKGDKIRSFHHIKYLSQEHTIYLACLADEKEDLQHVKTLEKYCAGVDVVYRNKYIIKLRAMLALLTAKPLSVASFYSKELQRRIFERLNSEKIDRIIVFSSAMAEYTKDIKHIPKMIDFIDVDSEKWRLYSFYYPFFASWIFRSEAIRLARYEEEIAMTFNHSIFVSKKEAQIFQERVKGCPISVIPNGVDLDYFKPMRCSNSCIDPPIIVFVGAMDYFPNVDAVIYFCNEIFPYIRKVLPEALFHIVGRNPTRRVKTLSRHSNVIVTGSVTDIRPYLAKASVAVAPFRIARGVQNKILESMAMGLPVIGTTLSFQGLESTSLRGIKTADHPMAFARDVVTLLQDQSKRHQYAQEVRNYIEMNGRWEKHVKELNDLLSLKLDSS